MVSVGEKQSILCNYDLFRASLGLLCHFLDVPVRLSALKLACNGNLGIPRVTRKRNQRELKKSLTTANRSPSDLKLLVLGGAQETKEKR